MDHGIKIWESACSDVETEPFLARLGLVLKYGGYKLLCSLVESDFPICKGINPGNSAEDLKLSEDIIICVGCHSNKSLLLVSCVLRSLNFPWQ